MYVENGNKLIKEFLLKVKSRLPAWLVANEDELNGVLNELNEHIKDKIEMLVEKGESEFNATRIAIAEMGDPAKIAKEYKRRGTPKYYITEELFPTYKLSLKILFSLIVVINVIVQVFEGIVAALTGGIWLLNVAKAFSGIITGMAFVFAGATILFTWLSMEGFFIEDIKDLFKSKEELQEKKQKIKEGKLQKAAAEPELPRITHPKGIPKSSDLIVGGCFEIIIASLAILQPFVFLNNLIHPYFLLLLTAFGVFWFIIGCIRLTEGIFSTLSYKANKYMAPIRIVISLISIPLYILVLINPQIFPIIIWTDTTGLTVIEIALEFYWLFYLIMTLIVIGVIASNLKDLYYIIKLNPDEYLK